MGLNRKLDKMVKKILEQLHTAYIAHRWMRIAACITLLAGTVLLLYISGGFPPWAWRFLIQVLPQLPRLWAARGLLMLIPLSGLVLLSVTLLLAWAAFAFACIRLVRGWWQERQELRRFDQELSEAQYLSESTQQGLSVNPFSSRPELAVAGAYPQASVNRTTAAYPRSKSPGLDDISMAHTQVMGGASPTPTRLREGFANSDKARSKGETSLESHPANELRSSLRLRQDARTSLESHPANELRSSLRLRQDARTSLDIGTGLDAGIKRRGSPNEDSLLAVESITSSVTTPYPSSLFIIADGMGGHGNGQEASQLAIRTMRESILMTLQLGIEDEALPELLSEAVQSANRSIYKRNQQRHADMGTTTTAALLWGTTAYIANVGDSRTYIYREVDGLTQVTQDHSTVARLVKRGAISAGDVYTHPKRNEIYRSLGNHPTVEVDTFTVTVQPGDILLLCSDGLWEMVRDAEIEEILRSSASFCSQLCAMLVQAALNRGGKDNISVIAVGVREE
jgi:serine/threonine protein phosphatase PrpC